MKRIAVGLIWCALGVLAQAQQPGAGCPAEVAASDRYSTFVSNFSDQSELDPAQWHVFTGQHGPADQEANIYLDGNARVHAGSGLDLRIDHESVWGHSYTAAWVETRNRFAQTYGHFEMLAKVPQANGVWPAFWLAPENGSWPPEIDVLEYVFAPRGQHPDAKNPGSQSVPETTLHWADSEGRHQFQHAGADPQHPRFRVGTDWDRTAPLSGLSAQYSGYHLYAVDWLPGSIVWYVDHHPVFCMQDNEQTGKRIPDQPMYMILSDSVAPLLQTVPHWAGHLDSEQRFPLHYQIAYVHAYQFRSLHQQQLPLDLAQVAVPGGAAHAGQTIEVRMSLKVGDADLGKGKVAVSIYSMLDPHQFYGMGQKVAEADATAPQLDAHHVYPLTVTVALPSSLPAGIYGVDVKANYTNGPGNMLSGPWPRGYHDRQAATIEVK